MKIKLKTFIILGILLIPFKTLFAQLPGEGLEWRQKSSTPRAIDFSKLFEEEEMTREEYEELKQKKEAQLKERIMQGDALETAVDPDQYLVGPGDVFNFNIWGAMEMQIPIMVSPEGKLPIPSVGEIDMDGKTLTEVKNLVDEKAKVSYENSEITLTLEALRFFRIHVVGEVKFPGTYIGQAVDRVSEMITEAGGVTDWAWQRKIEIRRHDGTLLYFDLSAFEQEGNIDQDLFVNGGDVIYVPPVNIQKNLVRVEGDLEAGGVYQIFPEEQLLEFLQRIRVLNKNMDLSKILVVRNKNDASNEKVYFMPFTHEDTTVFQFYLQGNDRVVIPSRYVYVKGAVLNPGAYPYVMNFTAKDYAGMAGGDYQAKSIKGTKVYHANTGKISKGPDAPVEAGDVVELPQTFGNILRNYVTVFQALSSLAIAIFYVDRILGNK